MNDNESIQQLIRLDGKRAIVTGGAQGLGYAISSRLAEAGATLLIADIDDNLSRESVDKLEHLGFKATWTNCDVSRENSVRKMVDYAAKEMGGIDILVNNAGVYPRIPLSQMTQKDFDNVMSVNLTGTFLCSKYASQYMIQQKRDGCIINLASIEAFHPASPGMSAYDSSKGGVLMLTRSLARELGQYRIRVNGIAPGGILTRNVAANVGNMSVEDRKSQMKELKTFMRRMVLGRMGEADEIARVALFLASELSSYMTGETVVVDGGYLIS